MHAGRSRRDAPASRPDGSAALRPDAPGSGRARLSILALAFLLPHLVLRLAGAWLPALTGLSLLILLPLPSVLGREGRRRIGFVAARGPWLLAGLGLGAGGMVVVGLLALGTSPDGGGWLGHFATGTVGAALAAFGPDAPLLAVVAAVALPAVLLSPFVEETLFRGLLVEAMGQEMSRGRAVVAQAALFALAHLGLFGLGQGPTVEAGVWIASMFVVALGLGVLRERSGSLWPPMVAHAAFNATMVAAGFAVALART